MKNRENGIRLINVFIPQASDLRVRLASPSQLQPKPEVDDLVFGKFFTDHMLKILWHRSLGGWQKPEITPMENLVIHPAAKVLHYAVEVSKIFHFSFTRTSLNPKYVRYFYHRNQKR